MKPSHVALLIFACCSWISVSFVVDAQTRQSGPQTQTGQNTMPFALFSEMKEDARLNDVCFVNPQQGWTVGDRGVIRTTTDGGTNWTLQKTPVDYTLQSVSFLNEQIGIAVGHYGIPFSQQGRGVILTTVNGGETWQLQQTSNVPPIHYVKMIDTDMILAAGETSERFPGGLLLSYDGGQTWRAVQTELSDGFAGADFFDTNLGIGIGKHGILQYFQGGISASHYTDTNAEKANQHIAAIKINRSGSNINSNNSTENGSTIATCWAVGDNGLILSSFDYGKHWEKSADTLPADVAGAVDLKTIEIIGNTLWAAGNPGTCIFKSNDAGKTWKGSMTGVPGAIRKIVFADAQNGWAVGDLGTILKTQNGGQSWHIQRTSSTKLSVLGLFSDAKSVPYEAFAALSANQGFLSGCALLFRNEHLSRQKEDRFHEAMVRVGSSIGTELGTFPIDQPEIWKSPEKLAEAIQFQTDSKGLAQLREKLVVALRQWKPSVLLTCHYSDSHTDSAVDILALREVMEAVRLARDSSAYPHHLSELGLSTWSVKKIYLPQKGDQKGDLPGDVNLTPFEPTSRLGIPLDQLTFISRNLVRATQCPAIIGFMDVNPIESTQNHIKQATVNLAGRSFFSGISLMPGENGRRTLPELPADLRPYYQRQAAQRRNVMTILHDTILNKTDPLQRTDKPSAELSSRRMNLAAHAEELTRKLETGVAIQILIELATQLEQEGDTRTAVEIDKVLTQQYPLHPLVRMSYERIMQSLVSNEVVSSEIMRGGESTGAKIFPNDPTERALTLMQYLEENWSDLAEDVQMRFMTASAQRQVGQQAEAVRYYQRRAGLRFDDVWSMRARMEYWLTVHDKSVFPDEQKDLPMSAFVSTHTSSKPFLDGQFDDEKDQCIWSQSNLYALTLTDSRSRLEEILQTSNDTHRVGIVRAKKLQNASKNFGTQLMLMHDSENWYLALRCPKVPNFLYPPVIGKQRVPDENVTGQDRVEILIDTDRDYQTYYTLTIDSRGWTADSCCGNQNLNLPIQIAQHEDNDAWYIEAAIPFSGLSSAFMETPIESNTIWNIAIRRIVPDAGIECWNSENSFNLTEGLGLLVFP